MRGVLFPLPRRKHSIPFLLIGSVYYSCLFGVCVSLFFFFVGNPCARVMGFLLLPSLVVCCALCEGC